MPVTGDAGPCVLISYRSFMSVDSLAPRGTKRASTARACDSCRRRKCNGNEHLKEQCARCSATHEMCTYELTVPRRNFVRGNVANLERRIAKMEVFLRRALPEADIQKEFGPGASFDVPEIDPLPYAASNPFKDTSDAISRFHENDPLEETEDILLFDLLDGSNVRYYGRSSGASLVHSAIEAKSSVSGPAKHSSLSIPLHPFPWEISPREHRPNYIFPPSDLMFSLIDLYFDRYNTVVPLLHRPTFIKQVVSGLHLVDHVFGANVLMVCANGSRYSNDPRVFLEEYNSEHTSGWKWFNQVEIFKNSIMETPRLFDLQFYILAALFLMCTRQSQTCWTIIGLGIRLAQDVGADRRKRRPPNLNDELWKRAWWALVVYDRVMSIHMGRQPAVKDEDFDQDLPVECDDEYWEHPTDPAQAFKQPPSKPSIVSCFIQYIGLIRLLGIVMNNMYCANTARYTSDEFTKALGKDWKDWGSRFAVEVDSALNLWLARLPEHLQWEPDRENNMVLHRPFLPGMHLSGGSSPSLAICTSAARSCLHIVEIQRSRYGTTYPTLISDGFAAATILLLNMWTHKRGGQVSSSKKDMQSVEMFLQHLKACENRWPHARPFMECIVDLASAGDLPLAREEGSILLSALPLAPPHASPSTNFVVPYPVDGFQTSFIHGGQATDPNHDRQQPVASGNDAMLIWGTMQTYGQSEWGDFLNMVDPAGGAVDRQHDSLLND